MNKLYFPAQGINRLLTRLLSVQANECQRLTVIYIYDRPLVRFIDVKISTREPDGLSINRKQAEANLGLPVEPEAAGPI